jgi:hypothetical protein
MKNYLLLLLLIPTSMFSQSYDALFLGNSYTFYNNMPTMASDIADSMGDTLNVQSNTPGGWRFLNHAAANSSSMQKIRQQDWDFVILQAQSNEPSSPPWQVEEEVYPYAQTLVDSIAANDPCTEPVFFMTWGRKYGDSVNGQVYPLISTYEGMQQRLRESYLEMGMDNDATVAPVGMAWKHSIDDNPNFELYTADEGHPNLAGSYLAACTFYCTLFQKSCVGSSYVPNGLSIGDATTLQTIASNTVLDSTWVWNMFTIQSADTTSTNDSTYSFSTTASNYDNLVWDFGDGNTSSTANASHTFGSGQHQVELSVFSNGGCLVKKETFDLEVVSANDTSSTDTTVSIFTNLSESIKLYPTPLNNYLTIEANDKRSLFKIYNMMGQLVYSKEVIGTERIDFNDLARGHYIAKIQTKDEDLTFKIFKNE